MQYIENILLFAQDYFILSILLGFIAAFIESFIPVLPLLAIATVNAAINGFLIGFLVSWIGSCSGTFALFLVINKLVGRFDFFSSKRKNIEKITKKIQKADFKLMFVLYTIPVFPSFLTTIGASYCNLNYRHFLLPMVFGKFLTMFFMSYIGSDIVGFLKSPLKISITILITVISYIIANILKNRMDLREESELDKESI